MNQLHKETSKYLLQHANNPVHWWPWGNAAFEEAERRNVPVLVSIGYTACHWCHVMEHESFESQEVANFMNMHFVNIKVDREERPDVDAIYMDAVQAIAGSGGWPLNIFVLPNRLPFYGGTYFPPTAAYNRPSWMQVLQSIHTTYSTNILQLQSQAENLAAHLANAYQMVTQKAGQLNTQTNAEQQMAEALLAMADTEWGGFGNAPKFLQTGSILYLIRHFLYTKHQPSLAHAEHTVQKMLMGGIYDQLGGGIARYSTDKYWQAPHFEKMLYDNALFLSTLAELYGATNNQAYKNAIVEIVTWLEREMKSDSGLYFASIDADSEGEEGKYYTWQASELKDLLKNDYAIFEKVYQVEETGNWEHTNILWRTQSWEQLSGNLSIPPNELELIVSRCKTQLLEKRAARIFPEVDDKQLLGWNALLITALASASYHCNEEKYLQLAISLWDACTEKFLVQGNYLHTYSHGVAKISAFADDYAYLIQAGIALANFSGSGAYWLAAFKLQQQALQLFSDEANLFFQYTNTLQPVLVANRIDTYDGATPCANSVFAHNLTILGTVAGKNDWCVRAASMLYALGNGVVRYPNSFSVWSSWLQKQQMGTIECIIYPTKDVDFQLIIQSLKNYCSPYTYFINAATLPSSWEAIGLVAQKKATSASLPTLYICINNTCSLPVNNIADAIKLLVERASPY